MEIITNTKVFKPKDILIDNIIFEESSHDGNKQIKRYKLLNFFVFIYFSERIFYFMYLNNFCFFK